MNNSLPAGSADRSKVKNDLTIAVSARLHDALDAAAHTTRIEVAVVARSLAKFTDLHQHGEAGLLQRRLQTGRVLEIALLRPRHGDRAVRLAIDRVRRGDDMHGLCSSRRRG